MTGMKTGMKQRPSVSIMLAIAIVVSGCGASKSIERAPLIVPLEPRQGMHGAPDRFEIVSYGKFRAGHFNREREILVIIDKKTGKEYLAITGCGAAELYTQAGTDAEE